MTDSERLRAIDALWLDAEEPGPSIAIGGLAVCAGTAPSVEELRDHVASRLEKMPRLSQRVVGSRGSVLRPTWEATTVAMSDHVHHLTVEPPGDDEALDKTVSQIMETPLDLTRPLWDMHLITGLDGNGFALVTRIHHAVADGQGSLIALGNLIDVDSQGRTSLTDFFEQSITRAREQQAAVTPAGANAVLDSASKGGDLTLRALRKTFMDPVGTVARAGSAARRVGADLGKTAEAMSVLGRPRLGSVLGGDPGQRRFWHSTQVPLEQVKQIKNAHGVTVNDVVMTLASGGYAAMMRGRSQATDGTYLRILIPVSTRAPGNLASNNQVSGLFVQLPVFGTGVERLAWIRRHINHLKDARAAEAGKVVVDMLNAAPAGIQTLIVGMDTPLPSYALDSLVTNVPGPTSTLYSMGRPIVRNTPIIPLGDPLWCTVGVMSYDGILNVGISTGDDGDQAGRDLRAGIHDTLAELLETIPQAD